MYGCVTVFLLSCSFLHIAVAQGRRALSYVLARKMAALHMLDIKEHNGQVRFPTSVCLICAPECSACLDLEENVVKCLFNINPEI